MTWRELQNLFTFMPNLRHVEFGYNDLTTLDASSTVHPTIQTLNLDSNQCHSWLNVCQALQNYTALGFCLDRSTDTNPFLVSSVSF